MAGRRVHLRCARCSGKSRSAHVDAGDVRQTGERLRRSSVFQTLSPYALKAPHEIASSSLPCAVFRHSLHGWVVAGMMFLRPRYLRPALQSTREVCDLRCESPARPWTNTSLPHRGTSFSRMALMDDGKCRRRLVCGSGSGAPCTHGTRSYARSPICAAIISDLTRQRTTAACDH